MAIAHELTLGDAVRAEWRRHGIPAVGGRAIDFEFALAGAMHGNDEGRLLRCNRDLR